MKTVNNEIENVLNCTEYGTLVLDESIEIRDRFVDLMVRISFQGVVFDCHTVGV